MAEDTPEISPEEEAAYRAALRRRNWIIAAIIAAVVLIVAGIGYSVFLLSTHPTAAANVRDIFIIFIALESLIVGVALVVLIIQVATLINLLQNELKPILNSTSETINTLRGTTEFLSENLVEPVIKLNSSLAGLRRLFGLFSIKK